MRPLVSMGPKAVAFRSGAVFALIMINDYLGDVLEARCKNAQLEMNVTVDVAQLGHVGIEPDVARDLIASDDWCEEFFDMFGRVFGPLEMLSGGWSRTGDDDNPGVAFTMNPLMVVVQH